MLEQEAPVIPGDSYQFYPWPHALQCSPHFKTEAGLKLTWEAQKAFEI